MVAKSVMLQRYHLKDKNRGEYFGDYKIAEGRALRWYTSTAEPRRIGVVSNGIQTEGNVLVAELLRGSGDLELNHHLTHPVIRRLNISGIAEIVVIEDEKPLRLADLMLELMHHRIKYIFPTSQKPDGTSPTILTFSPTAPSSELYKTGSGVIGPIEVQLRKIASNGSKD